MNAYLIRTICLFVLLAVSTTALAEAEVPYFRVDVIVFSHAEGHSDGRLSQVVEDFTALTDPRRRAAQASAMDESRDTDDPDGHRQAEIDAALELIEAMTRLEEDTLTPALPAWPEPYVALDTLSPRMMQALERLERSSAHHVLAWQAWHQPLEAHVTAERIRLHDDHVVAVDWVAVTPTGISLPPSSGQAQAPAHEPRFHYRLDGGLRLRQRQFMHMEVDLHWRVPPARSPWMAILDPEPAPAFETHRLHQSRTVRPARLEYFDSNWLGVLVLIEELERPADEETDSNGDDHDGDRGDDQRQWPDLD